MKIIPWSKPHLNNKDRKYLNKAFDSTWISDGRYVRDFEKKIQKNTNRKFAIATSSGTTAIHLAYLSLGLKRNDEIVIPAYGYMACANIAKLMNLKVIFCDVDVGSYCASLKNIKEVISKKTKAVVVINTYGNMSENLKISNFLKKKKIYFIEDAAESLGSKISNIASGKFGDISTFSFHATKNVTTGEGGMILTDNPKLQKKIKLFRSHGVDKARYKHLVYGHNFRMSNLLASIGYSQSKRINSINKQKVNLYQLYLKYLNLDKINLQDFFNNKKIVPWTFALTLKKGFDVKKLSLFLLRNKIESRNGFYSPGRLSLYKIKRNLYKASDFLSANVICLPFYLELKEKNIKYICSKINSFLNN
jgi:perosamine synthetase